MGSNTQSYSLTLIFNFPSLPCRYLEESELESIGLGIQSDPSGRLPETSGNCQIISATAQNSPSTHQT